MPGPFPAELLDAVDRLGFPSWSGLTYRHTAPGRNPLSGAGAREFGGRWNPPGLLSTIYLAQPRAACIAEFHRMAEGQGQGPASFRPRSVFAVQVTDLPLLDLTGDGLGDVGLTLDDLRSNNWSDCQVVGAAAHFLGASGLVAPSATGVGLTLAVFETKIRDELAVIETSELTDDEAAVDIPVTPDGDA